MRKSIHNPAGVPDFLFMHPERHDVQQCGVPIPAMFEEFCHATFPGSIVPVVLGDLFGLSADRPVFTTALNINGLLPINHDNMSEAFLYLRDNREAIYPLLDRF
jgi:hypothetical protein